jgi:protein-S-isoprenylcysteine O-methyltransferase Ste14
MTRLLAQLAVSVPLGLAAFGLMVFLPAGTFDYWQGWVFIAVFALATLLPSVYLAVRYPEALRRRMQAGPGAEERPLQKAVIVVAFGSLVAMIVLSALDWRFGWSRVPAPVSVLGAVLVAVGLGVAMSVTIQNGYAAANVVVASDQVLASTGWYGLVRHPMYLGNVVLMIGIPLSLGSYWALLVIVPGLLTLALRITDEEKLLTAELPGYPEYAAQVRYRLVPGVW